MQAELACAMLSICGCCGIGAIKYWKYLVAPRGYTQWVRNVIASGKASLVKGLKREEVDLRPIADEAKSDILKDYLDRYSTTVQRYFPVRAGSPVEAFQSLAARYPVFEVMLKQ